MRSLFLLIIIGLGFASCKQSDPVSPEALTGVWIEKTARKDTLIFNLDRSGKSLPNTILVNRGKEINAGGYLTPKIGSGLWSYEIRDRRIYMQSLFSSYSEGDEYTFEQVGSELRVGNFFELGFREPATATRILVRL